MIMTAHIQYPSLDDSIIHCSKGPDKSIIVPATFSGKIQKDMLRDQLGYKGISISDALDMQAITNHFMTLDAIKKTFNAGIDIALMPLVIQKRSDIKKLDTVLTSLESAYLDGELSEDELNESVLRIIRTKLKKLIKPKHRLIDNQTKEEDREEWVEIAEKITSQSITLIQNNGILPMHKDGIGRTVILTPLRNQALAMEKHLSDFYHLKDTASFEFNEQHWEYLKSVIDQSNTVIVGKSNNEPTTIVKNSQPNEYINTYDNNISSSQWARMVLDYAKGSRKNTILISMRMPYDVVNFLDVTDAVLSTYNYLGMKGDYYQGDSLKKAIDTILGHQPQGKLPVSIKCLPEEGHQSQAKYDIGFGLTYDNIRDE